MDIAIICVPTPLNEFREPDLSYIQTTAESIAPHLRAGQLIILESTTYPGTTEEVLIPILEKGNQRGLKAARAGAAERSALDGAEHSSMIDGVMAAGNDRGSQTGCALLRVELAPGSPSA
jgi:hypothetical protein